jgi:hypothetical protein
MEHDLEKVVNMKLILCIFEQISSLKINFHKSKIYVLEKQKMRNSSTSIFWGVSLEPYIFGTMG